MRIRLGTRGSQLALVQTESVASRLRGSGHEVEIVRIVTEGDVRPIDTVPGEFIVHMLASGHHRAITREEPELFGLKLESPPCGYRIQTTAPPRIMKHETSSAGFA